MLLRFLAATTCARAVVEIGTGSGATGLALLSGMAADGTLTTIDVDPEVQRAARRVFLDAGHAPGRFRLINGLASEVLPRLTDGGYDLVVAHAAEVDHLAEAARLLRPGGMVALAGGTVEEDDERWVATVLPDGMLLATRTP
ncbi:O-methyltransferase [Pseudonocardia sp. WMMC193]|uniref:O-methyltransferase n=1 Tax=Pseudonocardia sp. WMMC193 TaxID=2911965 RepID=UPI001F1CB7D0|nr:class I SAM-dependent methyltransferase [Pseudonocardia sp. WMMC193]MCF7551138.1 class I SAM-dependent methyltransferase [Pseudonocardia sp. WMMC193]